MLDACFDMPCSIERFFLKCALGGTFGRVFANMYERFVCATRQQLSRSRGTISATERSCGVLWKVCLLTIFGPRAFQPCVRIIPHHTTVGFIFFSNYPNPSKLFSLQANAFTPLKYLGQWVPLKGSCVA